jgi:hypothetical protein
MGVHGKIGYDKFPQQGAHSGKKVEVCFNYDAERTIPGLIVRDDAEDPFITLIVLRDGRFVLSTECQYRLAD